MTLRPQNQNSYSTVKLIFNKGFGKWSFTLNGAISLNTTTYSTVPSSGTIRSTQAGAELKYSFGECHDPGTRVFGNAALSGTYYYQYQNSPSVLNVTPGTPLTGITITGLPSTATQIFAQRGTINLAQIRLEMGSGSSLKFPIAISYSNRTRTLITKPEFRLRLELPTISIRCLEADKANRTTASALGSGIYRSMRGRISGHPWTMSSPCP